jgi:hypothetical protein
MMGTMTAGYNLEAVGDFNGDHTSDILWRNDTTGDTKLWLVNNGAPSQVDVGHSGTDFKVVA